MDFFKKSGKLMNTSKTFFPIIITIVIFSFFNFLFCPPVFSSESHLKVMEGNINRGETFYQSLTRQKIAGKWIHFIVSKLSPLVDFRRIRGTESYQCLTDEEGELNTFVFKVSSTEIYKIEKDSQGEYLVKKKIIPLRRVLKKVEGEISNSLVKAMKDVGEHRSLAFALAEALAWELDFSQDVRKGDRFKVLVEKIYKGDTFIKYGVISAFEYRNGKKIIRGIRFKNRYYDEKGVSLERAFLKAPLRFKTISSGFNPKRRHPIMGGTHPHLGIDYAAPIGTPVWAMADGVVVAKGRVKGFGRQVVLRHRNGYKSYYSHLSKYGHGIKIGKGVNQKQIIGYVGSTGFSTGPHLDYRLSKNGKYINPLKETFSNSLPVASKDRKFFYKFCTEQLAMFKSRDLMQVIARNTSTEMKRPYHE